MRDDTRPHDGEDEIRARVEALSEELSLARAELQESHEQGQILVETLRRVGTQLCMLGVLAV